MSPASREETARLIRRALDETPVVDPHCHVRAAKPAADSIADIVLYHHVWIELVSAGMGQREVTTTGLPHELGDPGMDPVERVRRSLPWLREIRSTTIGLLLSWVLRDLYGLAGELDEANLERVARLVAERGRDRTWQESLIRERCKIESLVTVEQGTPCCPEVRQGRELAITSLASGKQTPHEVLAGLERTFGRELRSARDIRDGLARAVAGLDTARLRFVGLWVPACIAPGLSSESDVAATLAKVRGRHPLSPAEIGGFSYFAAGALLEELSTTRLRTVQLIVGAEVLPPHRSIPDWDGAFVGALGRLAGRFEDFAFNVSTASDAYTQDLGIVAKHVPNVSVAGHWWHTFYPRYIEKAIETRLDMVPMNKICAFFSDAYHSEWVYPKLTMVKAVWAEVLTERCDKGWCDLDTALDVVRKAFHDNPKRIYGL
jgi:hypothetical protein